MEKEEFKKRDNASFNMGALAVAIPMIFTGFYTIIEFKETLNLLNNSRDRTDKYRNEIYDVRAKNDSLQNILDVNEFYLQTKDGKFVSYETVMQQEKAKLDSIYQLKQDSLKGIFENKLEKELK